MKLLIDKYIFKKYLCILNVVYMLCCDIYKNNKNISNMYTKGTKYIY